MKENQEFKGIPKPKELKTNSSIPLKEMIREAKEKGLIFDGKLTSKQAKELEEKLIEEGKILKTEE